LLKQSLDRIYDLYIHHLSLLSEFQGFAKNQIEDGKKKRLPTAEDLNPNTRFAENPVLLQLENNRQLQKEVERRRINWADHVELVRRIFTLFKASDQFKQYMSAESVTYKDHRHIVYHLYEDFVFTNEHLLSLFEERSIFWVNDFDQVGELVVRTISEFKATELEGGPLPGMFKDEEEDRQFVIDLFRKTAVHSMEFQSLIEAKLENWDLERIASTDILLMKMAMSEFVYMNSIPTRVTMNEYIEIAKEYSTPKSHTFINGILDKVLIDLKEQGKVKKTGKGLIGG
jgi:N utilization substance protein B